MRMAAEVTRMPLRAFSFAASSKINGQGILVPLADYKKASRTRTSAFL